MEKVWTTPEHRFMLRDGSYIEAQHLLSNDSLMPLYTKISTKGLKGYRLFYQPMTDKWHYEHRKFAEEVFDEKHLVHHKDCNPLNNNPNNLIYMSKSAHVKIHAELQTGANSESANRKKKKISYKESSKKHKTLKNGWLRYYSGTYEERIAKKKKRDEEIQRKRNIILEMNKLFNIDFDSLDEKFKSRYRGIWANHVAGNNYSVDISLPTRKELLEMSNEQTKIVCEYYNIDSSILSSNELQALKLKYKYETEPEYKQHIASKVSENHKLGKYRNIQKTISRRRWYQNGEKSIYIDKDETPPEGFVPGRIPTWKNHKVVQIEFIDRIEDVYDLTIKDNPNFAIASGVFVHNSKDQSDAVCGSIYNASQHADEFAFEWGENVDVIAKTNQPDALNRQQMTIAFEQELLAIGSSMKPNC